MPPRSSINLRPVSCPGFLDRLPRPRTQSPLHFQSLSLSLAARRLAPSLRLALAAVLVAGACKRDSVTEPSVLLVDGDRLAFVTEPTATQSGQPLFPAVRVAIVDSAGNVVPRNNVDVKLYLDSTDPRDTLQGQTNVTTILGVATFPNLGIKRAPTTFRLIATARALTGAISASFGVSVGPAAKLAFTAQPSNVVAGEKMVPPPVVVVQDAQGNFVSNDTGLVVLQIFTGGSGTVPRNNAFTAVGGTARFDSLRINTAATLYTLSAVGPSGRGLAAAVSNIFNVTHSTPEKLVFSVNPPTNTLVGVAFSPFMQVTVTDSMSNIATTFTGTVKIDWDYNTASAVLVGTTSVASVAGVARFPGVSVDRAATPLRIRATIPTFSDTARTNFFQINP